MIVTYIDKLTNEYQIIFDAPSLENAIERFWCDSETDKELLFVKRNRITRSKNWNSQSKFKRFIRFDSYLISRMYESDNQLKTMYNPFKYTI